MNPTLASPRRRPQWFWFAALGAASSALLTAALFFGGCTDDPLEPRRGFAGDSCLTTNDCVAPLPCTANVCGGPTDGGGSGGSSGSSGSSGAGGAMLVDGGTSSTCDKCLDTDCATELAACDLDCYAIEACIEMQCKHLSEIGSPDEGSCFVNCQSAHPKGKNKHLAVVNCSQSGSCMPPCVPYPQSYEECRAYMDDGLCKDALAACNADLNCQNYSDCVAFCSSISQCVACDDTPEGQAGRKLRENYELCVASECISESWLPTSIP